MSYCDDGGKCHHGCKLNCYRRSCCVPLSGVFPNDEWPPPSGAEVHETDPTIKPTPSITVGTQVRLTGVVTTDRPDRDEDYCVTVDKAHKPFSKVYFKESDLLSLEVIRQPFKRGEVVHREDSKYVVVEDEQGGSVKLTTAFIGAEVFLAVASDFERRP